MLKYLLIIAAMVALFFYMFEATMSVLILTTWLGAYISGDETASLEMLYKMLQLAWR